MTYLQSFSSGTLRPLSTSGRYIRMAVLAGSTMALAIASNYAHGQKGLMGGMDCYFQKFFHFPGPACGLTRSLVAFMQGDWYQAFQFHFFGPLLALFCVGLMLWSSLSLITQRSLWREVNLRLRLLGLSSTTLILTVSFLSYYALRLSVRYDWLNLSSLEATPLWQLLTGAASQL
ncbi:DUF2752 domain-containing protein [Spirulina sp. CS-785/01]|uniref:DUF2752 domain-containing protein n=1 Tax=Spirulina sp. CS-785/01 TaxID=3021716 RepID=UPI00232D06A6|nr:DUF2752 domain-containing protein [Spirulina sp. CS-785/01]MDB9313985.1 DUF2752 domain-containing protein [Spirulina sp. CS-785/01]